MHRLLGSDRLGGAEDAVGAAHAVVQVLVAFLDEELPRLALVVDNHRHDVAHLADQLGLGPPERDLVADLIEVAHRLRAFAVQAADRQTDLLQAAEDLVDLPGDDQRGQVQHHAHAHARAHVGRAGGEIAEPFVEGVGHLLLDQVVDAVDLFPDAAQVQAALHHLDPQVVLLVDHQAELLAAVDGHGAGALALGVLAADQVPLDEKLTIDLFQPRQVDVQQLVLGDDLEDPFVQDLFDPQAVLRRGAADEGEIGQVARQADAAADDDVGLGARAPQPLAAVLRQVVQLHVLISLRSRCVGFRRGVARPARSAPRRWPPSFRGAAGSTGCAARSRRRGGAAACPRAPTRRGC